MSYKLNGLDITVSRLDTFAIPFVFPNHILLGSEKVMFTVRAVPEMRDRRKEETLGRVLFQLEISATDTTAVQDVEGNVVGCQFFVTANREQSALIPYGHHLYDMALIGEDVEKALIEPHAFKVVEVLR